MHIRARFVSVCASCVVAVWVVWCLTQAPQDGAGPQAGMTQPRPLLQVALSHHTVTSPSCSYGLVVLKICGCVCVWVCAVAGAVAVGRVVGGVAAAAAHHGTLYRTHTTNDHRYALAIVRREEEKETHTFL